MEVTKDIIVEATGLEVDGINFYRDNKISNKVVDEFAEMTKSRNQLVKIGNSYFSLHSISRP